MGRRSDHSRDEIRDMAIKAATSIVEKEGFQALTARKVAAAIGYTVGTLYHVFRNFDDLVIHVNARTIDEIGVLIEQQTRKKRNPEARIRVMAEYYVQYATNHPDRWRLVFARKSRIRQAPNRPVRDRCTDWRRASENPSTESSSSSAQCRHRASTTHRHGGDHSASG